MKLLCNFGGVFLGFWRIRLIFQESRHDGASSVHVARVLVSMSAKIHAYGDGCEWSAEFDPRFFRFRTYAIFFVFSEATIGRGGFSRSLILVSTRGDFLEARNQLFSQFVRQVANRPPAFFAGVMFAQIEFPRLFAEAEFAACTIRNDDNRTQFLYQ